MNEVRQVLQQNRPALLDRWDRQLRAAADAGFGLDPVTSDILPLLLDATDRALERKFRPIEPGNPRALARKAAMQSSLLGDFLFDAALEALPELSAERQRELSDALAHAAVEVLVSRAVDRVNDGKRRELQRFTRIAHDLRDAMTSAQLAFDLLRARDALPASSTTAALERSLRRLRDGLEDAALDELLTAGGLRHTTIRLGPVLAGCVAAADELGAASKHLTIEAPRSRLAVVGDPRVLRPALRGLLRAAIEVARPDSILRVETAASARSRNRIAVHVPRCKAGKLASGGQLALLRRAAKAQGGAANARPDVQSGYVFSLDLPAPL